MSLGLEPYGVTWSKSPFGASWHTRPVRKRSESPEDRGRHALAAASEWDRATTSALTVNSAGTRRVFTRRNQTVLFACEVTVAGTMAIGPTPGLAKSSPADFRLLVVAILLAGTLVGARTLRRAAIIDGPRLIVRNFFTSWRADAAQIAWFAPSKIYGAGLGRAGILVRLTERRPALRSISVFAATPSDGLEAAGSRECLELNAWLIDTRTGHVGPSPHPAVRTRLAVWAWRAWLGFLLVFVLLVLALVIPALVSPGSLAAS